LKDAKKAVAGREQNKIWEQTAAIIDPVSFECQSVCLSMKFLQRKNGKKQKEK